MTLTFRRGGTSAFPMQLPFAEPRVHLPAGFDSWQTFRKAHIRKSDNKPRGYPPHHEPVGDLISGRFLVMVERDPAEAKSVEYIAGFFRLSMDWISVARCSSDALARRCAEEWADLSKPELMKAVWIVRERLAVRDIDIPRQARMWHALPVSDRAQLWRLVEAGAPGSIVDVIEAGKACGLFSCT